MSVQAPSRLRLTPVTINALAAAGFGVATLVAFYLSVTIGLFNFKEIATGEPQVLAEVAEYVAVAFGLLSAWMSWRHSRRR
jgi:hypothetical protein